MASGPVLFLDIDGVLNSGEWMRAGHMRERGGKSWAGMLCPEMCARLERVLAETGASIVLSTSWRSAQPATQIEAWLRERGATSARIVGQTPNRRETEGGVCLGGGGGRGNEIQAWLNANPCERFAVGDDCDCGDTETVARRFVQTSWARGIEDEHAEQLIALLSGAKR